MSTDKQLMTKPAITSVDVNVFAGEGGATERWTAYVYPVGEELFGGWDAASDGNGRWIYGEHLVDHTTDVSAWLDETGMDWSDAARAELAAQLSGGRAGLPTIIDQPPQPRVIAEAIDALTDANDPPVLFRRGGEVSEVKRNERGVSSAKLVETNRLRERLGEVAEWQGMAPNGRVGDLKRAPGDIAAMLLTSPHLHLPPLDAVVEHPVMGKNGRLRTRRGYDGESATYYAPSRPIGQLRLDGGASRVALSWLNEAVEDFEFASRADKVNWLAFLLTPILRPVIDGSIPLCVVRAARAGNGKSLLAGLPMTILLGYTPPACSLTTTDEDEDEKRLTALLQDAEEFIFIDNVPTGSVLRSAALARALTTGSWKGRIIRTSKSPTIAVRSTFVATGNNLTMSDELARRAYMIELTSSMERPDLRPTSDFHHPHLLDWARANRPQLLESALTLVQAWVDEGCPVYRDGPTLQSFGEWAAVVGSVLQVNGVRGFLENEDRKREIAEDDTGIQRSALLQAIRERVGDEQFTVKELRERYQFDSALALVIAPFLPDRVSWTDDKAVTGLGNALRPVVDGIYGGLQLVRRGTNTHRGGRLFKVRRA